jgi:hypothetical protein
MAFVQAAALTGPDVAGSGFHHATELASGGPKVSNTCADEAFDAIIDQMVEDEMCPPAIRGLVSMIGMRREALAAQVLPPPALIIIRRAPLSRRKARAARQQSQET